MLGLGPKGDQFNGQLAHRALEPLIQLEPPTHEAQYTLQVIPCRYWPASGPDDISALFIGAWTDDSGIDPSAEASDCGESDSPGLWDPEIGGKESRTGMLPASVRDKLPRNFLSPSYTFLSTMHSTVTAMSPILLSALDILDQDSLSTQAPHGVVWSPWI